MASSGMLVRTLRGVHRHQQRYAAARAVLNGGANGPTQCVRRFASERGGTGKNSNPFEIQFYVTPEEHKQLFGRKPSTELPGVPKGMQDDIDLLHDEMTQVFGSEPQEYDGDGGDSIDHSSSKATDGHQAMIPTPSASSSMTERPAGRPHQQPLPTPPPMPASQTHRRTTSGRKVLLVNGPCTFIHGRTTSQQTEGELELLAQSTASQHGLHVDCVHSNHEGQIVDILLNTDANAILLNWNVALSSTPLVHRAINLVNLPTVLLSQHDLDHRPLPSCLAATFTATCATERLKLAIHTTSHLIN